MFREHWDESEIALDGERITPPTTGTHAARYYISTTNSISEYWITLETFSGDLHRNFELTFEKGLERNRIDRMRDQHME